MRWLVVSCLMLLLPLSGAAADGDAFSGTLTVSRPLQPPVLDGLIDPCYRQGDSVRQFIQQLPNEGQSISETTTAFAVQDDRNLYVAVRCRTPGRRADCRPGNRDSRGGDEVSLFLSTFNDRQSAYRFTVNAANVQADAVISSNGLEENISWEGVFASRVFVDTGVFVVELAIPWTALSYQEGASSWGFNLQRAIPLNGEIANVVPIRRNEGLRVLNFAELRGVEPKLSGLGLSFMPNSFSRWEKSYSEESDVFKVGADLNWTLSPGFRLQATFNPDFAQIEADAFSLNLSRYETYVSEKRPFFVECAEYFQPSGGVTGNTYDVFYSRKIGKRFSDGTEVPLRAGVRLVGKTGCLSVGSLVASTGQVTYEDWSGRSTEPDALFTTDRISLQLGGNTTIGALYAGKYEHGYNNDAVAVDGTVSTSTFQLTGQLARSQFGPVSDVAGAASLSWTPRSFQVGMSASCIGDNFDVSQIGYVPWAGLRSYSVYVGPTVHPAHGLLSYGYAMLQATTQREAGEATYSNTGDVMLGIYLRNNWDFTLGYSRGRVIEADTHFDPVTISYSMSSDVSRKLWFLLSGSSERSYNYLRSYLARNTSLYWYTTAQPLTKLSAFFNGSVWVEQQPDGDIEETTWRLRPGLALSITQGMNLKLYQETTLYRRTGVGSVRFGVSFKYNFLPKSWLYLACNDYERRRVDGTFQPLQRVFVAKLTYMLPL